MTSAVAELEHLLSTGGSKKTSNVNPSALAHAALEELRNSGDDRFLFLRTILEQPTNKEELLFHCIAGCRHVILHFWQKYHPTFRNGVRDFFMLLGHQLSVNSRTLQIACYITSVAIWKRSWSDFLTQASNLEHQSNLSLQEQSLLQSLRQLPFLQSSPPPFLHKPEHLFGYLEQFVLQDSNEESAIVSRTNATIYLNSFVGEFSGTKSATSYNLPLNFHRRTHKAFEKNGLNEALRLSMGALSRVIPLLCQHPDHSPSQDWALYILQVTQEVIGWEFGDDAFESNTSTFIPSKTLLRPPVAWNHFLQHPDLARALWELHSKIRDESPSLAHSLRQFILSLASLTGPIFPTLDQRRDFSRPLLQGTLELLSRINASKPPDADWEWRELVDTLAILARLVTNFKWAVLIQHKELTLTALQGVFAVGSTLWQQQIQEAEAHEGDLQALENSDWREEALSVLLEGVVSLGGDSWLWYSGKEDERRWALHAVAQHLGPLYGVWVAGRTRLASLEESYLMENEQDVSEDHEHITSAYLEEEMESVAILGRLNLYTAIGSLSELFQRTVPLIQSQWKDVSSKRVTPQMAALSEENRLLVMYVGHLLTDDNTGETPVIPDAIIVECEQDAAATTAIVSAVEGLFSFAQTQAEKIAVDPSDPRVSPLLAKSFLWFLTRWAPAYLNSKDYGENSAHTSIGKVWSSNDKASQAISFCVTLCLHIQSYWPHERPVQDSASLLLMALAKSSKQTRAQMVASPAFSQMLMFHCLTAGTRHGTPPAEFEASIRAKVNPTLLPSFDMVKGYYRLPYNVKASILTALLVSCSEKPDEARLSDCLTAIQDAFSSLVHALIAKKVDPQDVNTKEMTCLCVDMFCGVARASEMTEATRIPKFVTPHLLHLSGLMTYYAEDLTICERLLSFFRDYAEHFVVMLGRDQCLTMFQASSELLKSYSTHHCATRVVVAPVRVSAEAASGEEQKYSDIHCAIELLIHLGTKDFIDICSTESSPGVDTTHVTDVIFLGLQHILPLMSQGLLQLPSLCNRYFSLVGFMMDTYPEKVCVLPYELFDSLLQSLLFGMCHHDSTVAKSSLQGLSSIVREHLTTNALGGHLTRHGDIFDRCSRQLLREVVFQNVVWDRIESAGMALLPLVAVDVNRFAEVVRVLLEQVPSDEQKVRIQEGFQSLIRPEVIAKVASSGVEGRTNRIRFKKDFEVFVHDIHSFLILK